MEKQVERSCYFATFLAILLLSSWFHKSNGLHFSPKKPVFLVTYGTAEGVVIGKVTVEDMGSDHDVVYSLSCAKDTSLTSLLPHIDSHTGRLRLLKNRDKKTAKYIQQFDCIVTAVTSDQSETESTEVVIIRLPQSYGDSLVDETIHKVKTVVKKKNGKKVKISPNSLLHSLRAISKSEKENSQITKEEVLELIKEKIKQRFEATFGNGAVVHTFLQQKQLFSKNKLEEIELEGACKKQRNVDTCRMDDEYRTIDGTCNNRKNPNWGASDRAFIRLLRAQYHDVDNLNDPIGYPEQPDAPTTPSPFKISNDFINDEIASSSTSKTLTHVVMQFGQFLDHDLDLAVDSEGSDKCREFSCENTPFEAPCYPILPLPNSTNCISVIRSAAVCQEDDESEQRQQINGNTAFVDLSQVYGSTNIVAEALRQDKADDQGLLRSLNNNQGELLPLNPNQDPSCENLGGCFFAGDVRANEQAALASFQSLFLREHNRIARKLKSINNHWNGESVYQEARKILGAVFQKITYYDYLPVILGRVPLRSKYHYNRKVDPGISNVFATAAYRFGHSTIRPEFELLGNGFNPIAPAVNLRFMFFNNTLIQNVGIEPLLFGLVGNLSENVDRTLSPGIVKHLFERENSPGLNLAALNIQRSRDHGLPGYNKFRKFCRLSNARTFEDTKNEITDPENRKILKRLYNDDPNLTELWVAGLAEAPVPGGSVGPTFKCIIADQFRRTRDGDRFYFEKSGMFTKPQLKEIKSSSLSRIYCDNLKDIVSIQKNAFKAPTESAPRFACEGSGIPGIDLCLWKDCENGHPVTVDDVCQCKCKKHWSGNRCDVKSKGKDSEVDFDAEWPWSWLKR